MLLLLGSLESIHLPKEEQAARKNIDNQSIQKWML
jgi:hypothetical protein